MSYTKGARKGHIHVVSASQVARAVRITDALRFTAGEGVTDVILDAGANGTVVAHIALGVATAGSGVA